MEEPKPKIPAAMSRYAAAMARRANAKLRGTEAAKIRSAKGVAARLAKLAERKAVSGD